MSSQSDIEVAKQIATNALKEGNKTLAIKIYQTRVGVDQATAEHVIEGLEHDLGPTFSFKALDGAGAQPSENNPATSGAQVLSAVKGVSPSGSPLLSQPPTRSSTVSYQYKMVQVPPVLRVQTRDVTGNDAAIYLESVVNEHARQGWEFYRVDTIGVIEQPGCLAALLGQKQTYTSYYVVSFRRCV